MIDDDTAVAETGVAPTQAAADASPASRATYRHYKAGELLGRGGMGEVVSAEDPRIGRSVAIKRMRSNDPALVERFVREARIQGQLEHPAIVPVYELGEDDAGAPVIVMKQIRGTTLGDVLRAGSATRQRLLRAFVDVCLAVELAHSRGIVHRDLKPANIALGDFGEVYVLDWGIARVLGEQDAGTAGLAGVEAGATSVGTVMGTRGYMSPEQERGDVDLDARADVFALGRVLVDILGDSDAPELHAAAARASSPDRADRFTSARALAQVVERVLDGDRDLAQRRKLAAELLADARAALSRDDRSVAMRSAGRALALDPGDRASAGIVAQLMLEPPREMPIEAEREIVQDELRTIEAQRHFTFGTNAAGLLLLPLCYWLGIRDTWFYVIGIALLVLSSLSRYFAIVDGTMRRPLVAALWVTVISVVAWSAVYLTPLLTLPFGILVCVRCAMQPRLADPRVMLVLVLTAVFLPLLVSEPISTRGGDLVLHVATSPLDPSAVIAWTMLFIVYWMSAVYATSRAAAALERDARRARHLQAWQLRQLVG